MSKRGLLDADMRTIGQWLRQGWEWWLDEMRALVPQKLRDTAKRALPRLTYADGVLSPVPPAGSRATVVLPRTLALARVVTRPALNDRDVHRMALLEGDTLLPIPSDAVLIAARAAGRPDAGTTLVEVAGLPVERAQEIAAAILSAKVIAVRVVLAGVTNESDALDFAMPMRAAGLLPRDRSATPLVWALVVALVALNLGAVIWRDSAQVDHLEQRVLQQQPGVTVAKAIAGRSAADRRLIATTTALRESHDALGALALVGDALPRGVWLQRYVWDGPTVRLVGYRPAKVDVATALRKSGRFSGVRSTADETQPSVPSGEPFDVAAGIGAQ